MTHQPRQLRSCLWNFAVAAVSLAVFISSPTAGHIAYAQTSDAELNNRLTLSQAVEIALTKNPLTKAAAAKRQLTAAQVREARAGRLPLLQLTETFTRSNNPVFVFGSLLEQGRFGAGNFALDSLNHPSAINNFRTGLALRLPLFDQRSASTRLEQARIKQQQSAQETDLVEQQVRFEVIRSYYALLLAAAKLEVAIDAVRNTQADVKRVRDLFETGVVVQADLLATDVQLAEFRQEQIQRAGELNIALAGLNTALGLPVETPQQLADQLIDRDFPRESLELLFVQAMQNRPDYIQATLQTRASQISVRGARGEWLPRVDLFASAGASSGNLVSGSGDYAAGANVSFSLFDAGRKPRIEAAEAMRAIAIAEQDHFANRIKFEVLEAFRQHETASGKLTVVAGISEQAEENLRIVQDRYQVGLTTITEVLRSETALVRARVAVLTARHDEHLTYASLLLVSGKLRNTEAFGSP